MTRAEMLGEIGARLATVRNVFVLTGAGMGVASGLSTFRGPGGYWRNRSFEQLASLRGFQEDPTLVWEWYNERIAAYLAASPNAGHVALAELQEMVPQVTIATQNVDGLHARAGSRNLWELHGSIFDVLCTSGCADGSVGGRTAIERLAGPFDLRRLEHEGCGGMRRPGVVWFGERLPERPLAEAAGASRQADAIIVAGTSAQVEPAASLAQPWRAGVLVVEVNPEPALRSQSALVLAEGTETGLPAIVKALRKERPRAAL